MEKGVRAGCGALLGLVLGGTILLYAPGISRLVLLAAWLLAPLCALLALRYGDRFWGHVAVWLDWVRPPWW